MALSGMSINQALIARIGGSHAGLRRELNAATRTVRSAGSSMRRAFGIASRAAALVTAAVVAIGGAAVKMASDFETGMAEVSTLLDVSLSGIGDLTAAVKGLSLQFGVKLTEQAQALYQTISAGATESAEATKILTVANKAAAAGVTNVAVATEAIMRVINSYSLDASAATRVSDALFTVVKKGVTTFGELAPKIGEVAGTAAVAGIGIEELMAIIATATKRLPIEQVITGVNQLFLSLIVRTKDAELAAEALGIQWDASALAAKGMSGVLNDLIDAMGISLEELEEIVGAGADTAATFQQITNKTGVTTEIIAALFPNIRALRVALAVLANEGKDLAEQMEFQARATGATEEAYQKMAKTFGFLARQVKQELAVAFVELGETLFPIAREIVSVIGSIARKTREWVSANRELVQTKVEGVFTGIVRGTGKVIDVLVGVVEFFKNNPLTGEFGLVGLVFLGPMGAATFSILGLAIDKLTGHFVGATTVSERLSQNISDATDRMDDLRKIVDGPWWDVPMSMLGMSVEEAKEEMKLLIEIINMNTTTLMNLGDEGEEGVDKIITKVRELADALQGFSWGDFSAGFGGGGGEEGGETPTGRMARDMESMRFSMAEIPMLTGEVSAKLDVAAGKAAYLAYGLSKAEIAAVDVANALQHRAASILTDLVTGTLELADAMKKLGQMILQEVVGALIKAAIYAAILKPLLGGIGIPGFQQGGVVKGAQHGMVLPPYAPSGFGGAIPIYAHPGEAVLTKRTVAALGGGATITAMNRGDHPAVGGGGQAVEVRMILPDADAIPEPLDYGVLASKPQMIRFMAEALRQARFVGTI